jgi:hypothetical protein
MPLSHGASSSSFQAARLLLIVIAVASGLALPLFAFGLSALWSLGPDSDGGGSSSRDFLLINWLVGANLIALWNLILGIRWAFRPAWRRVALLYWPTALLILAGMILFSGL